ncbi:MAG: helix-hairpin-helix domain-containing protein, partial [Planctomycetota bacterium]
MSTNEDIGAIFEEMATLLELTGANGFRVNAHTKVARVVEGLASNLADIARGEQALAALQKIDGIGKSSAEKIVAFVETGTVAELDALRAEVPDGLRAVMQVPGLGPKTVRRFWQEASVESLADLEAALDDGRLEALPRMGRKTLDNIRASVDFMKSAGDRRRLGDALPLAERVVRVMEALPGMRRVAWAGSLRRGQETIGDVDILVSTDDPDAASAAFREQPGVSRVLVAGETKSSVRLEEGIQVDLRVVPEEVWGATLLYFTGSKDHNVALRE